jgi:hypothetical protein
LRTVHDDDVANDSAAYDELTDFRADQHHGNGNGKGKNANHTGSNHDKILAQRQRRAWPVANLESDYECGALGLNDKTYGGAMTAEATVATLWDIAMAGGYTGYYYTYTAWDVIHPLDAPKGYTYMKNFGGFWRGTKYWQLQPSDHLASSGHCLANPGKEYVVYQNKAAAFTVEIAGAAAPLAAVFAQLRQRSLDYKKQYTLTASAAPASSSQSKPKKKSKKALKEDSDEE